jgi:hypothetical protein
LVNTNVKTPIRVKFKEGLTVKPLERSAVS